MVSEQHVQKDGAEAKRKPWPDLTPQTLYSIAFLWAGLIIHGQSPVSRGPV